MGSCFTKTEYRIIIQNTPQPPSGSRPPANTDHGKPPSTSPEQAGRKHLPACGVVVWPALQRPMLDVRSLYILERVLPSGQFETMYLCTERATGFRYACRSMSKRKLLRPVDVEGVRREVAVLQHLRAQPNVAEFRAAFEDADSVHLIMELCSGGELLDRVAARGTIKDRMKSSRKRHGLGAKQGRTKEDKF
jgi:calcium-dependent protein kinase